MQITINRFLRRQSKLKVKGSYSMSLSYKEYLERRKRVSIPSLEFLKRKANEIGLQGSNSDDDSTKQTKTKKSIKTTTNTTRKEDVQITAKTKTTCKLIEITDSFSADSDCSENDNYIQHKITNKVQHTNIPTIKPRPAQTSTHTTLERPKRSAGVISLDNNTQESPINTKKYKSNKPTNSNSTTNNTHNNDNVEYISYCVVCFTDDTTPDNPLLKCRGRCASQVHYNCYYGSAPSTHTTTTTTTNNINNNDKSNIYFKCDACYSISSSGVTCHLCKQTAGLMKRSYIPHTTTNATNSTKQCVYIHIICVLFCNELTVNNQMEANNLPDLNLDRNELYCQVCIYV